jgi:hypothetical protein
MGGEWHTAAADTATAPHGGRKCRHDSLLQFKRIDDTMLLPSCTGAPLQI